MEFIEAKIRRVGTSFGVLIPKKILKKSGLKCGEKVQIALVKKNLALIESAFGSAKAKAFRREHYDRVM